MKTVDKVGIAIKELGPSWTRKAVRARFPLTEISNAVLDNTIMKIRKSNHIQQYYIVDEYDEMLSSSHLISAKVWSLCVSKYGPQWGRLLAYILSCHEDEVLVSQEVLASCHPYGFGALLNGKKPNIKNLANDVYKDSLLDCPYSINISDYIPDQACRVVENYECPEEIQSALEEPSEELVDVFTGKPAKLEICPAKQSPISSIEDLRLRLLGQQLDYQGLIEKSLKTGLALVAGFENIRERVKQFSILTKVAASPNPNYSAASDSLRLYAKGASFQCLSREVRGCFFAGMRQFDLKHAQLCIIATLWDSPEILGYFEGRSVWKVLQGETKLGKETLKKGIYTLIFGGTYAQCVRNMAEVSGHPQWLITQQISSCRFFKILEVASKRYSAKIKQDGSCKDAFGRELVTVSKLTDKMIRSIKGVQAQSFEIAIMVPVLNHLLDKGFNCWLFLHDGFISDANSYMIHQELKGIAEVIGKQYGINVTLEMESID